jgi:hypothetical protein
MSEKAQCEVGHILLQPGRCPHCTAKAKFAQKQWRKPAPSKALPPGSVYHAYYDMIRYGGVTAQRLQRRTNKIDAAQAWSARWDCSPESGQKQAYRLYAAIRITVDQADRWCVALGTSLSIVYPEVYFVPRKGAMDKSLVPDDETVDA